VFKSNFEKAINPKIIRYSFERIDFVNHVGAEPIDEIQCEFALIVIIFRAILSQAIFYAFFIKFIFQCPIVCYSVDQIVFGIAVGGRFIVPNFTFVNIFEQEIFFNRAFIQ